MNQQDVKAYQKKTLEIWMAVGAAIGQSSLRTSEIANQLLERAVEEAVKLPGGISHDSPLGTMWVKEKSPRDEIDSHYLKLIQTCSVNYEREGVTADDVMWFWDLSTIEREVEIQSINFIRMAVFYHYIENGGSFTNFDEAAAYSAKIVEKYVPSFDRCLPSVFKDNPSHPLPWELISTVSKWYLAGLAKYGLNGIEEITGRSGSANEEARRLVKSGAI
jgi:hypothetical protein